MHLAIYLCIRDLYLHPCVYLSSLLSIHPLEIHAVKERKADESISRRCLCVHACLCVVGHVARWCFSRVLQLVKEVLCIHLKDKVQAQEQPERRPYRVCEGRCEADEPKWAGPGGEGGGQVQVGMGVAVQMGWGWTSSGGDGSGQVQVGLGSRSRRNGGKIQAGWGQNAGLGRLLPAWAFPLSETRGHR